MKMFKSGSYRFIDNPNNLIFRLNYCKLIKLFSQLNKSNYIYYRLRIKKSTTHKVFENDSFDESDISSQTFEEHFIKWQQKIFSQVRHKLIKLIILVTKKF
jgi:hypothetical protein